MGIMKSRVLHFIKGKLDMNFLTNISLLFLKVIFLKIHLKRTIHLMKKRFPDRIFLTSLKDIVDDTEKKMKKISKFLNKKFDPIFTKITYLSKEIKNAHTFGINDDKHKVSTKSEFFLNLMSSNWTYLGQVKKYFFIKYFKEVLISIYLKKKFFFIKG